MKSLPHYAPKKLALTVDVPAPIRHYIRHVKHGVPIRQIARDVGCHASTVQRQIQKVESARDDALFDEAIDALSLVPGEMHSSELPIDEELSDMETLASISPNPAKVDEQTFEREATRLLRRLSEPGACMAVAKDMEKAVVVRETPDGRSVRTAITDRTFAQNMVIRDWLVCTTSGRVTRYQITNAGRATLRRMLAEAQSEDATPFADQHRDYAEPDKPARARGRQNLSESPIQFLSRRRNRDGNAFLSTEMVSAAERLREDFELSQMGPRVAQNWDNFLTGGAPATGGEQGYSGGSEAARKRVSDALSALGPGLGDVALRVCCFLEGLETTEKRLGWSARSAKVVLRIALDRLHHHYQSRTSDAMIG
jgi:DNA-binding MarR family transcriptional regulator